MAFKTLPILNRKELQQLQDACTRSDSGCLLYHAPEGTPHHLIRLRGQRWCVARIAWAEAYGVTVDAMNQLNTHEVNHIAECPNTGDFRDGEPVPACIEPTHLVLGDRIERRKQSLQRLTAYGRTA